jgi:geranylgeranyl diphosphate synthase type II
LLLKKLNLSIILLLEEKSTMKSELETKRDDVNRILEGLLGRLEDVEPDLREAIAYALQGPGKRIRSAMLLWCCELISGQVNRNAEIAAAAIEMVHTYSLVHDDLPAMDDDDLRRGRATCHKVFGESTAILAGDALLTLAFEILAGEIDDAAMAVKLIGELSRAAGPAGMIAGQFADIKAENIKADKTRLEYIHTNKTAKMFGCAAVMGGIAGGANASQLQQLREYGVKVGLGFQIADDILDIRSSSNELGKTAGKDQKAGKMTYPALVGIEESKRLEKQLVKQAIAALEPFGSKAEPLRQLAEKLLERKR